MSLSNLQQEMAGTETTEERDVLGGTGAVDSNVYDYRIELAYTLKSKSGALGFMTVLVDKDGRKHTDRQYITSGDTKGNKPYYEKEGKKFPLPGFSHVDFMVDLLLNKSLTQLDSQEATIKLYDGILQKEVPTSVTVYPELRGKQVKVGLLKIRENKTVKQGSNYVKTNEERVFNEVNKYFDFETSKTKTEIKAHTADSPSEAAFIKKWINKNQGQVQDNYKELPNAPKTGASPFAGEAKSAGGQGHQPTESLFGSKDNEPNH